MTAQISRGRRIEGAFAVILARFLFGAAQLLEHQTGGGAITWLGRISLPILLHLRVLGKGKPRLIAVRSVLNLD